jgi:hypothetical protein
LPSISKGDIVGMFIGRVFLSLMERTTMNQTSRAQKMRKLRRDSGFHKCRQGPRDRLIGGENVETHEYLENLLSQRDQKVRRKSDNGRWITDLEDQQPWDRNK